MCIKNQLIVLLIFLLAVNSTGYSQSLPQQELVDIDITDGRHFQLSTIDNIPFVIIIENSKKNGYYPLTSEEVLRFSTNKMNDSSTMTLKLESHTVDRIRENLELSLLGDLILLRVIDERIKEDVRSKERGDDNRATNDRIKRRIGEWINKEIREVVRDKAKQQYDETYDIIDKWDSLLAASNGTQNEYRYLFEPINIFEMMAPHQTNKKGANPNWFIEASLRNSISDLSEDWEPIELGLSYPSLRMTIGRSIFSRDLGKDISLGLYGFAGFDFYQSQLSRQNDDTFISGEYVADSNRDFYSLISEEGIVLQNNQFHIGSLLQLYKYRSIYLEIGVGWQIRQRGNIRFLEEDSDDNPIDHLGSGLSLVDDDIEDVIEFDDGLFGLVRLGYLRLSKDRNDSNYGLKFFASAQFYRTSMKANNNFPFFQEDGVTDFVTIPIKEDSKWFVVIDLGIGFNFLK